MWNIADYECAVHEVHRWRRRRMRTTRRRTRRGADGVGEGEQGRNTHRRRSCLLYTSDAADDTPC
eukprot:4896994-Pyramimonas_sp.AAC.1